MAFVAGAMAIYSAGKAMGVDILRLFGTKDYPPGGELYNQFYSVGYDVDLDVLGGTKNAWFEYFKPLVEEGVEKEPLIQFRNENYQPPVQTGKPPQGTTGGTTVSTGEFLGNGKTGEFTFAGMSLGTAVGVGIALYMLLIRKR